MGEGGVVDQRAVGGAEPMLDGGVGQSRGFGEIFFVVGDFVEKLIGADHQGGVVGPLGLVDGSVEFDVVEVKAVGVLEFGVEPVIEAQRVGLYCSSFVS